MSSDTSSVGKKEKEKREKTRTTTAKRRCRSAKCRMQRARARTQCAPCNPTFIAVRADTKTEIYPARFIEAVITYLYPKI